MIRSVVRTGPAVVAATAVLLTAACSGSEDTSSQETATQTAAATQTQEPVDRTGPVDVPDVTVLILETAQTTLGRFDLETEVVDESGEPVEVDDATQWVVAEQDPADGEVERGSVVTLTVRARG